MKKYLKNWLPVRIILGVIVVLIEIGSVIQEDWGTAVVAMIFALFLTVSPASIMKKIKLNYGLSLTFVLIVFFVASNQTMESFNKHNPEIFSEKQK